MGIQILPSLIVALCISYAGVDSAVFTVKNNCRDQIWPATQTGQGAPALTGFELAPQASKTVDIPSPWSGRFWARSQCSNSSGKFACLTGDCNSGQVECGVGGTPPASLAEFTLAGADGKDFFDISLVDGFNLPMSVSPDGSGCQATACPGDINNACPDELAVKDPNGGIVGCKSACVALNQPQYCCTGAYGSPDTCKPTNYSQIFKSKCPQAYSYAYDDKTSLITCPTGGNYAITFCP
ncbi:thaumatin-like protein 1 [Phtheirospermum japonicum]|uniref:Thaumatin-like protein 1 n=1 Tax=Phtheirospermum japonicum TaxID=374723 RepID=A0A830DBG9_9LAMI|nr:thaumatin-like protein 1 [Phtheirospermum japonicum]